MAHAARKQLDADLIRATEPPYDLILGSDILYEWQHSKALAETIIAVSRVGTKVLIASPDWSELEFGQRLKASGFEIRDISTEAPVHKIVEEVEASFYDQYRGSICVWEMVRRQSLAGASAGATNPEAAASATPGAAQSARL